MASSCEICARPTTQRKKLCPGHQARKNRGIFGSALRAPIDKPEAKDLTPDPSKERIGHLDIESSGLKADFALMLSWAIKEDRGPIFSDYITRKEILNGTGDKRITATLVAKMMTFDRLTGQFSTYFDIPFIRSRALFHGIKFPNHGEIWHTDVWREIKRNLCLRNNRLQTACEFLDIPSKQHRLIGPMWFKAQTGDPDAIKFVLAHNLEDCVSLEKVFQTLYPFMRHLKNGSLPHTSI